MRLRGPWWQVDALRRMIDTNRRAMGHSIVKLKVIHFTAHAVWYEHPNGQRHWVPNSVSNVERPYTLQPGEIHDVRIANWWLKKNPFERPAAMQDELL